MNGIHGSNHSPVSWSGKKAKILPAEGLQFANNSRFMMVPTIAAAKLVNGSEPMVIYVQETRSLYEYCSNCQLTADDDLIITTLAGGNTRWEQIYRIDHSQGDTGWIDIDGNLLSRANSTTLRLTVATKSAYACKGVRYELLAGNYDLVITGSVGVKFIYIDKDMVLKQRDTFWNFKAEVPVAIVNWTGSVIAVIQTEFHGIRDTVFHEWAHKYIGPQWYSGLSITDNRQPDNNTDPNVDTVQFCWLTTGEMADEDITWTPGTGQWLQTLGSGLTAGTALLANFLYYNGTNVVGLAAMADRTPFPYTGVNGAPQWNNAGTLQASTTGQYTAFHIFVNPYIEGWAVFIRPHNAVFTSLAAAQQARPSQLTWTTDRSEIKHIYTLVFRTNTGWNVTHRCKLVSVQDFRQVQSNPTNASNLTDHSLLSNRDVAGNHAKLIPVTDSTTAIQITNNALTPIVNVDTTNSRVGINTTTPYSTHTVEFADTTVYTNSVVETYATSKFSCSLYNSNATTNNYTSLAFIGNQQATILRSVYNPAKNTPYMCFMQGTIGGVIPYAEYWRLDSANLICGSFTWGAQAFSTLCRTNGTSASPTAIVNTNVIGDLSSRGYQGPLGSMKKSASVEFLATADWTDNINPTLASSPTAILFKTTGETGSTNTERMRITASGNIGINKSAPDTLFHSYFTGSGGGISGDNAHPSNALHEFAPTVGSGSFAISQLYLNKSTIGDGPAQAFAIKDSAGNKRNIAYIAALPTNVTDDTESGDLKFYCANGGVLSEKLSIGTAGAIRFKNDNTADSSAYILYNGYGTSTSAATIISWRSSRGTVASPSAVQSGDIIGGIGVVGYHSGGAYSATGKVAVFMKAAENWTSGANGTKIEFETTASGGTSQSTKCTILGTGNMTLTGNYVHTVKTITASDTMLVTDSIVLCDHATVAITYTLLAASGENRGPITIKRINDAAVTIDGNGSETIDGNLTVSLPAKYSSITIVSNGSNWFIL